MIISLDSSILIAAAVETEIHHAACDALLDLGDVHAWAHAFTETFSHLTGGRLAPRLAPDLAAVLLSESLLPAVSPVVLSAEETFAAMKEARARGVRGGAIYDYLHLVAARKIHAQRIYTLNVRDFRAFWRPGDPDVVHP